MILDIEEFKNNLDEYLDLLEDDDIYITKDNVVISKLFSPYKDKLLLVDKLYGSISNTLGLEEAKVNRVSEI